MSNSSVKTRIAVAITLGAAALSGCTSPKAATEGNFAEAINAHYAKPENCAHIRTLAKFSNGDFPATVRNSRYTEPDVLNAMVKEGVLTSRSVKTTGFGGGTDIEYSIEPSARDTVQVSQTRSLFGSISAICVGRYAVQSIENFTEPTPRNGMTVSMVRFTRVVRDVPKWAQGKAVVEAANGRLDFVNKSSDSDEILVLTNKGWEVGR